MSAPQLLTGWLFLFACAASQAAPADAAMPILKHNPFALPAGRARAGAPVPAADLKLAPEKLQLHAVIPGGRAAMASVNGHILAIGDRYAGYTLLDVGIDHARFLDDNGEEFRLQLRAREGGGQGDDSTEQVAADNTADTTAPADSADFAPDNLEEETNAQAP